MLKICPTCKIEKSTDEFHKNSAKSDGFHNQCKICRRKHYDRNRDNILQYNKKWNDQNRDIIKSHNQNRVLNIEGRAKQMWHGARLRAIAKGLAFEITPVFIQIALRIGTCQRTGIKFDLSPQSKYNFNPFSPSVDKKNPFGGYTFDNVQIVITAYNIGKGQSTDDEFLELCRKVVEFKK